jgi:hypothetical protein
MNFAEAVREILNEGYLKLSHEANTFLSKVFIPKLKQTTVNYNGVLVFDIIKAARTGNYKDVYESKRGGYEFTYELTFKDITVVVVYTNLKTTAWAEFDRLEKIILIYIPCVSIIKNKQFLNNFKARSFSVNELTELQKQFTDAYKDINKSYLPHMTNNATYQRVIRNIEHELIHAIDPASYQSKDDSEESLLKYRETYLNDYYGTPERNAGNIPAEFNPFFWNIVSSFERPLNSRTRQFLLDFIKTPQPIINKLKLFDIQTLDIGKFSNYVLSLFKQKDKDYISFITVLNDKQHRKLLLRIFQDNYLKKKFLQKLYLFVQEN